MRTTHQGKAGTYHVETVRDVVYVRVVAGLTTEVVHRLPISCRQLAERQAASYAENGHGGKAHLKV